jgi:hypothetical protein
MEYFVSVENTLYYHWQMELMIESFKVQNCQKDLLIGLAEEQTPIYEHFWRNMQEHPRIYGHANIGKTRGFEPLNRVYSLSWAVKYGLIKQPFAYIQSDLVLKNPLDISFDDYSQIVFCPNAFFTIDSAEENAGDIWSWMGKSKSEYDKKWIPVGSVIVFNNIPTEVFDRTVTLCEMLALHQLEKNNQIWKYTDRLAWAINLSDFSDKVVIKGDYTLTGNMLGSDNSPFIDYEHGLPPVFNKSMYSFSPPSYASFGDPFLALAENAPTPNAHYISELAKINLRNR